MTEGEIVFLSASVPWREGWTYDAKPAEIEEAIVCLARAVFARKGRLLFGGHPSVSPLVASVASEYFPADTDRLVRPIITFQSEFFKEHLPDETWELARMGWASIHWTDRKETKDESLALMRETMLTGRGVDENVIRRERLGEPRYMVAVGGMDGIRDEAAIIWEKLKRPIYLLKSGGAAAARLLDHPDGWMRGLWPGADANPEILKTLFDARQRGALVDLEERWWNAEERFLPRDIPFQPYAAITQWLMDEAEPSRS
jgi:hypothetical protein